ncbi:tetratricopeptide repeat protein [Bradyrhizobium sp.]|uniref:tetratricopeptide repeat protein n=1 Tax=Bradyrhizobium sp. TaxID=376 RepID=UPI0039E2C8A0
MANPDRQFAEPDKRDNDLGSIDGTRTAVALLAELHASAIEHLRDGRLPKAQSRAKEALKLDAENAASIHLMAVVDLAAGRADKAIDWASRAIRKDPQPAYLATLGNALVAAGRIDEALRVFDKAVQLRPDDAELWRQMGDGLTQARRPNDALLCFRRALELDPNHADAAYKIGHILHGAGQLAEALVHLDRSVALRPDHAPSFHMRALVLNGLKRHDEAIADGRRAAELDPRNSETLSNLGAFLRAQGRLDEALSFYDRSLKVKPDAGKTVFNRANVLAELGRVDDAMSAYKRSAVLGPEHARAAWNLALLQMLTGDFKRGWKGRETRWDVPSLMKSYPPLAGPKLAGIEGVAGKTVLVCADEGLGDAIHFVRYVPMLAACGANVVLLVQDALQPLFSALQGVSQCLAGSSGAHIPPFDFHCPLATLPMLFGTRLETIPAATPYLPPASPARMQAWQERLDDRFGDGRLRVGLAWSGNAEHANDHNRSIPFRMLTGLLDTGAAFVSLQKEVRPTDQPAFRERTDILDAAPHLTDFCETAALISCLDLVISVDTSVVHLAGALGKPTWVLLPCVPDYRWLLGRDDSPWYPTVRLFRQTASRDYATVIDGVREGLTKRLDQPR